MTDTVAKPVIRVPALSTPYTGDGLTNFTTRLGSSGDKSTHAIYAQPWFPIDVDPAYRTSWLRKIVDIPPQDEVREWRTWAGSDE